LRYGRKLDGPGVCPVCDHIVLAPKDADAGDDETAVETPFGITEKPQSSKEVIPLENKIEELHAERRKMARDLDIYLQEAFKKDFVNKTAVDAYAERTKRELPQVESAYQPSGKMPDAALGMMIAGFGVSFGAAVLAEVVVGAISAVVIALLLLINGLLLFTGCLWCFGIVILVVVGLIALAAPYVAGGWAAAATTTSFGRMGKNRNETVAALLSVGATALSIIVVWLAYWLFGANQVEALDPGEVGPTVLMWTGHAVMGLGGIIALIAAWWMAATMVQEAKFCEECEEYMEESELRALTAGGMRCLVMAIKERTCPLPPACSAARKARTAS